MIKFGTGGWRALIGEEFCKTNVCLLAAGVAGMLKETGAGEKGFIVGYDRRFLSEDAARWVGEVMAGYGIVCSIIKNASPTPLIMYALEHSGTPYGMAITASHNPASYNGIKLFMPGGRDADEALTQEVEQQILKLGGKNPVPAMPYEEGLKKGLIKIINPMNEYVDSILSMVDGEKIRNRELKVVLDPMYGVSKTAFQTVLFSLRCDVETIHEQRDTLFGGRLPAPNMHTLAGLINYLEENECDIGIATDGDADRLGVVDNNAKFMHFNKILVLLYYYLLKYKGWCGPVVRSVATTHLLDKVAADFGQQCYEVPVGFKHVSSKMAETGAVLGGESSGGLTVKGHVKGKDGIYAGTLLIEMLAVTGRSLSELWKEITDSYGACEMEEADFAFPQKTKDRILKTLMEDKKLPEFEHEVEKVSYNDGCKVYFKNGGWVIARFSGTEPLLRIFCEMETTQAANKVIAQMRDFLDIP